MMIAAKRLSVPETICQPKDGVMILQREELAVRARSSLPDIFPEGPIALIEPLVDIGARVGSDDSNHAPPSMEGVDPIHKDALVQDEASNEAPNESQSVDPGETLNGGNDSDELEILEVRTLPQTNTRPTPGAHRRIKQEPGSEGSGNLRQRKTIRSKRAAKPAQSRLNNVRQTDSSAANMGTGSGGQVMFGVDDMSTDNPFSRPDQTSGGAYHSYETFEPFAHIPDLVMPPADFSPSNGIDYMPYGGASDAGFTGGAVQHVPGTSPPPPAYQPRTFEQIMADSHAALEERLSSRMTSELTKLLNSGAGSGALGGGLYHFSKRGRGGAAFTLEEAEQNLKTASHEYTKAKQAEERRANKRVKRSDKQEDNERIWPNEKGGGAGGGGGEKGGKGREKSHGS